MAPLINGASKAASVRTSRAGSTARDIIKHRDKPYKTEQHRILAKKRKLNLRTTYTQNMPSGYTFLPVGTPDLAERCKEISRKKDVPVNVVNAKPVSKNAEDPLHVSHHIARIGYHFRADIVDEAREQLGYVLYRGKFVKEADLQTQRQQAAQDSAVARAFERQGVSADHIRQKSQRETPDKVRAAIKELFPKIPDFDLDEIVRRAWEEGASRVGTNSQLGLPRRVQLATIARIRHTYTDYDQLLRAFEWKEARVMVEPGCLQKLIEWRGENEDQDDDELEEIVRETIVIDDDDDTLEAGISDAYTSPIEIDSGSDASVEIIHHVAAQDFGAESADDRSRRRARRSHPRQSAQDLRHAIAKQKIGDARERIRTRMPPSDITPSAREPVLTTGDGSEPGRINVQPDANGHYPPEIIVDGRRMRLVPSYATQVVARPPQVYAQPPASRQEAYDQTYDTYTGAPAAHPRPSLLPAWGHPTLDGVDRPAASIEHDYHSMHPGHVRVSSANALPSNVDSARGLKRREDDLYRLTPPTYVQPPSQMQRNRPNMPERAMVETNDLRTPIRRERGTRTSPMVRDDGTGPEAIHLENLYEPVVIYTRAPAQPPSYLSRPPSPSCGQPAEQQRLPYFADYTSDRRLQYGSGAESTQYIQNQPTTIPYDDYTRAPPNCRLYASDPPEGYLRPPYVVAPAMHPGDANGSYQRSAQRVPQPIHGAPAPIQQAYTGFSTRAPPPPGYKYASYGTAPDHSAATNGEQTSARYQPLHGAIAPTQYYHPS
ncbi:hypothetical protein LTR91_013465 [Friedmanniomyces endolithicus]|uniref:DUF2293 domain-containing protein n=1 Tax=Friedmanniomyces endolithicus TaxID=329885 RepID=A0AAN6QPH3_9PEZI|nr:hypothetical protein LTR38_007221 [Friedmanniomyces endolithicus]KAK0844630.1 hypothetical protein LTR03_007960 [Friedmanniomyces endolithicus]KAK0871701.1 hypothetical protein LTS02_001765 [Friedmanniomyces endolithicus]KAK0878867.1 hypothetical protein LTR87_007317 [Friedmanniomyces endolithicus]KAK0911371.1 hypothetical protein LTR57_015397 [Friedmanniomyces endolithicus]